MLIRNIYLRNFLSYGDNPPEAIIPLGPLNLIIGPNGSGKSNLLEAFSLLKHTPGQIQTPIREGGGIDAWLFKSGKKTSEAYLFITVSYSDHPVKKSDTLHYGLGFTESEKRFLIAKEMICYDMLPEQTGEPIYLSQGNAAVIRGITDGLSSKVSARFPPLIPPKVLGVVPIAQVKSDDDQSAQTAKAPETIPFVPAKIDRDDSLTGKLKAKLASLVPIQIEQDKSILAQRKDPDQYPEITYLAEQFEKIYLYRDWVFGRESPARKQQQADMPNNWLEPDASNLGLVLNRLRREPEAKKRLLEALQKLYEGIEDYDVRVEGGTVQVFFQEGNTTIPATRLSDGTLRYLSLLAILLHPSPPPLVCIEEPELGLHPDILPTIAELLKDASTRMQLIVTTHSDILVDAMTDMPEAVLVCEKTPEGSQLRRLNAEELKPWLEKYRLGDLWSRGHIGGNRW